MIPDLAVYIEQQHQDKAYRPVSVSILYDDQKRFLIVKTPIKTAATPWSFPQGGIDRSESLDAALARELDEELGIAGSDLSNIRYGIMVEEVDAEPGRVDKRGFTKGKAYIFSSAHYNGNGNLRLNADEVAEARWMPYDEAVRYLRQARPEKVDMLVNVLRQVSESFTIS